MLVACWSAKGGVGTTVVSVGLALALGRAGAGALLVDLAGDVPAAVGLPEHDGPGLCGWLDAGSGVPPDALARLEMPVCSSLSLVPRGRGLLGDDDRVRVLASMLAADARPVVVDCGVVEAASPAWVLAGAATRSVLVTRACFLALRRARACSLRPSEIVLVAEPGRSLHASDIADVLDAPVRVEVPFDPSISRAVDAGVLASHEPRVLARALRRMS